MTSWKLTKIDNKWSLKRRIWLFFWEDFGRFDNPVDAVDLVTKYHLENS